MLQWTWHCLLKQLREQTEAHSRMKCFSECGNQRNNHTIEDQPAQLEGFQGANDHKQRLKVVAGARSSTSAR